MFTQQFQNFCIVATLHQLFDGFIPFFFSFAFLVHHLATNE